VLWRFIANCEGAHFRLALSDSNSCATCSSASCLASLCSSVRYLRAYRFPQLRLIVRQRLAIPHLQAKAKHLKNFLTVLLLTSNQLTNVWHFVCPVDTAKRNRIQLTNWHPVDTKELRFPKWPLHLTFSGTSEWGTSRLSKPGDNAHRPCRGILSVIAMFQQLTSRTDYSEIIPILFSHVSSNGGHPVIGIFVRRMPNPWPPCAYKCISTGTPAFFSA